jgi:hypothetical protein
MIDGSKLSAHPGKPKALAFAAFLALIASQPTYAAITLSTVQGNVAATALGGSPDATISPSQTGVIYDSATSVNSATNNYATSRIFATSQGPQYGGSSFAAGEAKTNGYLQKDITFQATQTGNYSLTTLLYGGYLESSVAGVATGFGEAAYYWGVIVGGVEAFASGVTASFNSNGSSQVTSTGTALSGFSQSTDLSGAYASWASTSFTTQPFFLQANESVNISFYMSTAASSNYSFNSASNSFSYGCSTNSTFTEVSYSGCGSSRVSFGDPLSITGEINEGLTNIAFGTEFRSRISGA